MNGPLGSHRRKEFFNADFGINSAIRNLQCAIGRGMNPRIVIIDYGMGNLRNVQKGIEWVGFEAKVTRNKREIERASAIVLPGVGAFKDCMEKLYKFCWQRSDKVWSNGSVFDIMVAENAFRQLGMQNPWNFWNIRDCRTIYDIAGVSLKDGGHVTSHKAVEDAERQAIVVQDAYRKLLKAGFQHIK